MDEEAAKDVSVDVVEEAISDDVGSEGTTDTPEDASSSSDNKD